MTEFAVVVPAVLRAAASAGERADELRAEVERVRSEAVDVLSARWLGAAAGCFDRAWSDWDGSAREVLAALDELAAALRDSARGYAVEDAGAAERLRIIR